MLKYIPVPITDHDAILGVDFNAKFTAISREFYKPFQTLGWDIDLSKTTWERMVSASITGGRWVGAGKNVVDVETMAGDIDVKSLSVDELGGITTEASFLQNNQRKNDHFMKLFESTDFLALKEMFVDLWMHKITGTNNLHLLAILREKKSKDVSYCLLKLADDGLTDQEFVAKMKVNGERSVDVPMIDPAYGKTYIYISKRRLELRLNTQGLKGYIVHSHSI
jgi:hypothetical protein